MRMSASTSPGLPRSATALIASGMRARHAMQALCPRSFTRRSKVHGDQRLVLDDEDVGGDLIGDLGSGLVRSAPLASATVHAYGSGAVSDDGEALEGHEEEGLARLGRDRIEARRGAR